MKQNDEQNRHAAKNVGEGGSQDAEGKEDGRLTDPTPGNHQSEEQDEHLTDEKHPDVRQESVANGVDAMTRVAHEGEPEIVRIEKSKAHGCAALGNVEQSHDHSHDEQRGDCARHNPSPSDEQPTASRRKEVYRNVRQWGVGLVAKRHCF
jgi:hypothetical protein